MFQFLISHWMVSLALLLTLLILPKLLTLCIDLWRIRRELRGSPIQILSLRYAPFSQGWMSPGRERLYRLRYLNAQGELCRDYCKMTWLSPPFWRYGFQTSTNAFIQLQNENAELRQQIAHLEQKLKEHSNSLDT